MPETYTLARDGLRPVRFQGHLLAEESGQWNNNRDQNRYYIVTVYQLEEGRYLIHWAYRTQWQGEEDHARAEIVSTLAAVATALEDFDPTAWILGYKLLLSRHEAQRGYEEYHRRQAQLERSIHERYAAQVSALCATLDIAEDV